MEEKNFKLPETLGQEILNYLSKKPYIEVADLVIRLKSIELLKDVKLDDEENKKDKKK